MNGDNVRKAFENCRDKILDRIGTGRNDDFDETFIVVSEAISQHIEKILRANIDLFEKIVKKRLKELTSDKTK